MRKIFVYTAAFIALAVLFTSCSPAAELGEQSAPASTAAGPDEQPASVALPDASVAEADVPVVYFAPEVSPEALLEVYEAVQWNPSGSVAVKR